MGKRMAAILTVLLLCLCLCGAASAEIYVLDDIFASVDIPDTFPVVLRPGYLDNFSTWLEARGKTAAEVQQDMEDRGVLLQCWSEAEDLCFELTAEQSDEIALIYDVNEQSTDVRQSYRLSHSPRNEYDGYDFSAAEWNNSSEGRFLVLTYRRREAGETLYRGFMRRTIRNGYQITLDLQVHGRSTTSKDNRTLNKIWETFRFIEVKPMSAAASAQINITDTPPVETNQNTFTLAGTAAPGVKLTAVTMGLNYPDPILTEVTVGANGKFKMPVTLPKEGVYLLTLTGENQGEDVVELAYPVTYSRTLLPVVLKNDVPNSIETDTLTISGISEPGATIQLFLNSEAIGTKKVTSEGKFSIDFTLKQEGVYEIGLIFSKKSLTDRRLIYTVSRNWSAADTLKQLKKEAVKPGYATLVQKIAGYEGKVMGYNAYFLSAAESGDGWLARMALTRKSGNYSDIILVTCKKEPGYQEGQRITMYGTCTGMSLGSADGETEESYPCFDLLMFADIEE